jgi:hypothetical protein
MCSISRRNAVLELRMAIQRWGIGKVNIDRLEPTRGVSGSSQRWVIRSARR